MPKLVAHLAARPWDFVFAVLLAAVGWFDAVGNTVPPEIAAVALPPMLLRAYGVVLVVGGLMVAFAVVAPCKPRRALIVERAGHTFLAGALGAMGVLLVSATHSFESGHIVDYVAVMSLAAAAGSIIRAWYLGRTLRRTVEAGRGEVQ